MSCAEELADSGVIEGAIYIHGGSMHNKIIEHRENGNV